MRAILGKEICVEIVNSVGVLAEIAVFLSSHGINLLGVAGYARKLGEPAELIFMTDDNRAAIDTLRKAGYDNVRENEIIAVELEDRPGSLSRITGILSQNKINIIYIYGTGCMGGCPAKIVISTSDNAKAMSLLNRQG